MKIITKYYDVFGKKVIKCIDFSNKMCIIINVEWTRFDKKIKYFLGEIIMGNYVENNLMKNEEVVKKAEINALKLVPTWIFGILFCWLLFIPLIKAIIATVRHMNIELAVTTKRVVGKVGVANTDSLDAPLNKIQNVSCTQPFWGKIFNYGTVQVNTAAGVFKFDGVKNCNSFKGTVSAQIEQYEEDRVKQQAQEMANAMAAAIKG